MYLDILASIIIIVLSLCMLLITLQQPETLMVYFEMTRKEIVFTWRMRMVADVIQILFLISCGIFGQVMAVITSVLLFVAFTLSSKRPDIFENCLESMPEILVWKEKRTVQLLRDMKNKQRLRQGYKNWRLIRNTRYMCTVCLEKGGEVKCRVEINIRVSCLL